MISNIEIMINIKKILCSIVLYGGSILFGYYLYTHIIYNASKSIPVGWYWLISQNNYKKYDTVALCINKVNYINVLYELGLKHNQKTPCPNQSPLLLKVIVATHGDKVIVNNLGVYVNNHLIPNSVPISIWNTINLLPQNIDLILKPHEFFVMGYTKHSYDSRYFGIIDQSQIMYPIKPIFNALPQNTF